LLALPLVESNESPLREAPNPHHSLHLSMDHCSVEELPTYSPRRLKCSP
jgi:hypothetical protein